MWASVSDKRNWNLLIRTFTSICSLFDLASVIPSLHFQMSASPTIHPDLLTFLNYTRFQVKSEDIAQNVLNDPGSYRYFEAWESIRNGGRIPERLDFDFTEGIYSLAVGDSAKVRNPKGFMAYRRLTSAVGLVLFSWDRHSGEDFISLNYIVLNVVRDLPSGKKPYLDSARQALAALKTVLHPYPDFEEYPFLLLAEILLAQKDGDFDGADRMAGDLIAAESELRRRDEWLKRKPFLLGLTRSNRLHSEWLGASSRLIDPNNNPEMGLLMGLLDELRPKLPKPVPGTAI